MRNRVIQKEHERTRAFKLEQAKKIEKAYNELKATQAQLIHAEKMASLGELTAGIAHEIQNPLNFVNNFAEVSIELIDELKQESAVGGQRSAVGGQQSAVEIMDDIRQNLDKILHHGKRADSIVKGMLQHSRSSNGQKTSTDINALADEYLRLSYHGLRAKDKSFNADFKTGFDETLPQINVIAQDIGRVLLNLINNAFYAVSVRNLSGLKNLTGSDYRPTVTVSTRNTGNGIEITVRDNGNGIPDEIKDKIFQPFFTTKPTGEGTGLGLSLSYDIIKAHGGELKVETKEGVGTEFIIVIPI
jgi:signal transduction histidine kinase